MGGVEPSPAASGIADAPAAPPTSPQRLPPRRSTLLPLAIILIVYNVLSLALTLFSIIGSIDLITEATGAGFSKEAWIMWVVMAIEVAMLPVAGYGIHASIAAERRPRVGYRSLWWWAPARLVVGAVLVPVQAYGMVRFWGLDIGTEGMSPEMHLPIAIGFAIVASAWIVWAPIMTVIWLWIARKRLATA